MPAARAGSDPSSSARSGSPSGRGTDDSGIRHGAGYDPTRAPTTSSARPDGPAARPGTRLPTAEVTSPPHYGDLHAWEGWDMDTADDNELDAFWDIAREHADLSGVPVFFGANPVRTLRPLSLAYAATPEQADE